jgi:hypothetical protein
MTNDVLVDDSLVEWSGEACRLVGVLELETLSVQKKKKTGKNDSTRWGHPHDQHTCSVNWSLLQNSAYSRCGMALWWQWGSM